MTVVTPQPPYPLHPSVEPLLDPQYRDFYNKYIINQQQVHYQPVSASRGSGVLIPGAGEPLKVASVKDYQITRVETKGPPVSVRVFTPLGEAPEGGWPGFLYMHGGGWVLGNINTENVHCTNWCARAKCVVVSVDYRLAPEDVYPAAVHDTLESYLWMTANGKILGINTAKLASGGSSAGGNLTAVLTHLINERNSVSPNSIPRLIFQLLIVPVCDNTASPKTYESWRKYENTAALPAEKMLWYRYKYLPDESTWADPDASPYFASEESFKKCPPAFIVVAGLDVLRGEGERYRDKLISAGVPVKLKVYDGVPHVVMAMNGVLDTAKELVTDCCDALNQAFNN